MTLTLYCEMMCIGFIICFNDNVGGNVTSCAGSQARSVLYDFVETSDVEDVGSNDHDTTD